MILAVDTETTGTDFHHGCLPFMITACDGEQNYYWHGEVDPFDRSKVYWDQEDVAEAQALIDQASSIIMHNAKFDVRALACIGVHVPWEKVEDTLIASHVVCSGEEHKLKTLAFKYLDYDNEDEQELSKAVQAARTLHPEYDLAKAGHPCFPGQKAAGTSFYKMDYWLCIPECIEYGSADVEMTWLLWRFYETVMEKLGQIEQYRTRRALLEITYNMEEAGLYLYKEGEQGVLAEIDKLVALQEELRAQIQHEIKLANHLDLTDQWCIRTLLFDILGLPVQFKTEKTGAPSIKNEAIDHYIATNPDIIPLQHFSEYRKAGTKIGYLSSYVKYVCDDSRIHSNFLLTGTRETRQSSNSPNVQNIDKNLRHIFGPPEGRIWLDFDLVNIELRIWCYQVGNEELIQVFEDGGSVHLLIASIIHKDLFKKCDNEGTSFKDEYDATWYQWTKNGTFSIIYGASANRADTTYRKDGCFNKIAHRFPEVAAYSDRISQEAESNDLLHATPFVECLGGYRLDVDMEEPYKACNYKIQGSAGWIIGQAMINVDACPQYRSSSAQMVNQVHDSIVIEVDKEDNTEELRNAINSAIEQAGLDLLPTCAADYKNIESREGVHSTTT